MKPLKVFLTMDPPGVVSTVFFRGLVRRKITHSPNPRKEPYIRAAPCFEHPKDIPSLPVDIIRYSPNGAQAPAVKGRVCMFCWDVVHIGPPFSISHGYIRQVVIQKQAHTKSIHIGGVNRVILKYKGKSKKPYLQYSANSCSQHVEDTVPVSLIASRKPGPGEKLEWKWVADGRCCPLCWTVVERQNRDPEPFIVE